MQDNNNNDNDLRGRAVSIEMEQMSDGSWVFPVPTELVPPEARLVYGHSAADNPRRMLDMVFTFPRKEVEAYAAFLARHGATDREPTAEEVDTILQLVGNSMVQAQVDIMAEMSRFLINRLGNGDHEAARARAVESVADALTAESVKAGAVDPADARATSEQVARALREWAEGMIEGKDGGSDE